MKVLKELSTGSERDAGGHCFEDQTKPKLENLKRIVKLGEWSECARVVRRTDSRMMIELGRGTAEWQ